MTAEAQVRRVPDFGELAPTDNTPLNICSGGRAADTHSCLLWEQRGNIRPWIGDGGGVGQGWFCRLTSQNGIGDDDQGSTMRPAAPVSKGVHGAPRHRRVRFPPASATCPNARWTSCRQRGAQSAVRVSRL